MSAVFRTFGRVASRATESVKMTSHTLACLPGRSLYSLSHAATYNKALCMPNYSFAGSCYTRGAHSENIASGAKELVEFLEDEITTERGLLKSKTIPSQINGFQVKLDGSEVKLVKETGAETVTVSFNINQSVSSNSDDPDVSPPLEEEEDEVMKSKPNFEVDIQKDDTTLAFNCSYVEDEGNQGTHGDGDSYDDLFAIDDVTIYKGKWKETNYSVSGDVLGGDLYDLLMNILEEKGVSNEFVDNLSQLATTYEHTAYINLLQDLKKFHS